MKKPASDELIADLRACVAEVLAHDHPAREDLYCLNMVAYIGERMGAVLDRLDSVADDARRSAYAEMSDYIDGLMRRAEQTEGVGYGVVLANVRAYAQRRAGVKKAPHDEASSWGAGEVRDAATSPEGGRTPGPLGT